MKRKARAAELQVELVVAIGLVWGHLSARQFDEAFSLAQGCMKVWPEDRALLLMHAYAAAELLQPLDMDKLEAVRDVACEDWIRIVLQRMALHAEQAAEFDAA